MTWLLHLDLSLTSCVTDRVTPSPSQSQFFQSYMGWAGLSELWGFPLFEKDLGFSSEGCMGLTCGLHVLGVGTLPVSVHSGIFSDYFLFVPYWWTFFCVWSLFIFECVLGSLFSVWAFMFSCLTYIQNTAHIMSLLLDGFLQTKHAHVSCDQVKK